MGFSARWGGGGRRKGGCYRRINADEAIPRTCNDERAGGPRFEAESLRGPEKLRKPLPISTSFVLLLLKSTVVSTGCIYHIVQPRSCPTPSSIKYL